MKEEKLNQILEELELQIADCFQAEKDAVHHFQTELKDIELIIKSKNEMQYMLINLKTRLSMLESFYNRYHYYEGRRHQLENFHDTLKDNRDE